MLRPLLLMLVLLLAGPVAAAEPVRNLGSVVKALRPVLRTFDEKGQPTAPLAAKDLKLPAPIVAFGVGGSIGVEHDKKVIYLRGLEVQTEGVNAKCTAVQAGAREAGATYAATNMGVGSAADCARTGS